MINALGIGPASVFGTSSRGSIVLCPMIRNPGSVRGTPSLRLRLAQPARRRPASSSFHGWSASRSDQHVICSLQPA
jgi:hypothetical protein